MISQIISPHTSNAGDLKNPYFSVGDNLLSKHCSLGLAGFPIDRTIPSPSWRFPITGQSAVFPSTGPDYHLVHTLILNRSYTR
jgi:hypothetical protein